MGPVDVASTLGPGDATRIVERAVKDGVDCVLVGGGDGTASEIVDGLIGVERTPSETPRLGLLPLGSGLDLARSLELPLDLEGALAVIERGFTRRVDAGQVVLRDASGDPFRRCFVNEASVGLSASTVARVGAFAKRIGARPGFAAGAVVAIARHQPEPMEVVVDAEIVHAGPVSMVVVANGRQFGAGMRVAPEARLDDGRFEVVVVRGLSVPALLANLPSLRTGTHGRHPAVSFHSARSVEVRTPDASTRVEVDGELVGRSPFRAEILPAALEVFAPERAP